MNHSIKYSSLRSTGGITRAVRRFAFRTRTNGTPHMRVPARYVWQAVYANICINHPDWLPGFDERTRQREEVALAKREALKRYVATKLTPEARVCSVCKKDIIEECECRMVIQNRDGTEMQVSCSPCNRVMWWEDHYAYVHDPHDPIKPESAPDNRDFFLLTKPLHNCD